MQERFVKKGKPFAGAILKLAQRVLYGPACGKLEPGYALAKAYPGPCF